MNNGLGVAFADKFYHNQAGVLLPAVLIQLPIVMSVAILGRWYTAERKRTAEQKGSAGAPQATACTVE
jgi:predicted Na+-dependent transporter